MNKLPISGIDTNVCNAASAGIAEKYDIAGLKFFFAYVSALAVLIIGRSIRIVSKGFKDIIDESGAIKTGRGGTSVCVGRSQIFRCFVYDILSGRSLARPGMAVMMTVVAGIGAGVIIVATVSDSGGAGSGANTFSVSEKLGRVGRLAVFVGTLGQINIIASNVADFFRIDNFIPAIVQSDDIAGISFGGYGDGFMEGAWAGSHIHGCSVHFAIAKFRIFTGKDIEIILMHISFLEIVIYMVPIAGFTDYHNTFIFGGSIQDFAAGIWFAAKS